ncbi:signal peptidase I [Roseobacteraceae bacterium NS-SX3]
MSFVVVSLYFIVALSVADFYNPYYIDLRNYWVVFLVYLAFIVFFFALAVRPALYALGLRPIKLAVLMILTTAIDIFVLSLIATWAGGKDDMRSPYTGVETYFQILPVSTSFMAPTIDYGSIVLLRTTRRDEEFKHGEIVMYISEGFWSLGRVIATGGQSVEHNFKDFWVDGEKLSSSEANWVVTETNSIGFKYLLYPAPEDWPEYSPISVNVPHDSVFVVSDDRSAWEFDSRNPDGPGSIRLDQIVGKVVFVLFPTNIGNPYSPTHKLIKRMENSQIGY